jgi:hypothetical protein
MVTLSIIIIVLAEPGPGLPGCRVWVGKAGIILLGLGKAGLGRDGILEVELGFPAMLGPGNVFQNVVFLNLGFQHYLGLAE